MKALSRDAKGFIEGVTKYMQEEGKTSLLPKVERLFGKVTQEREKDTVAHVTTSVVLTDDERKEIEKFAYRLVGHAVTLDCRVDGAIIAGIKMEIGDWIVDTSLQGQLQQMKRNIIS